MQAARKHLAFGEYRPGERAENALPAHGYRRLGSDRRRIDQALRLHAFLSRPGIGGHCIPIDPFYLSWKAKEYDLATRFIELAGEVNTAMPYHVVDAIGAALNEKEKSVRGSRILLLGMSYKKNVDDVRESPGLTIMQLLNDWGAEVAYNDPYIPRMRKVRKHDFSHLSSVSIEDDQLSGYDCVVVVTDHDDYDYARIVAGSRLVVDTRNATRKVTEGREKVRYC